MNALNVCLTCPESRKVKVNGKVACAADPAQRDVMTIAEAHECPLEKFPARGPGDIVAKVLHQTGLARPGKAVRTALRGIVGKKGCGCDKTRAALNKVLPFKKD